MARLSPFYCFSIVLICFCCITWGAEELTEKGKESSDDKSKSNETAVSSTAVDAPGNETSTGNDTVATGSENKNLTLVPDVIQNITVHVVTYPPLILNSQSNASLLEAAINASSTNRGTDILPEGESLEEYIQQVISPSGVVSFAKGGANATEVTITPNCTDQKRLCPFWHKNGWCERAPEFMGQYCKASCSDTCVSKWVSIRNCTDDHPLCEQYSENKMCVPEALFMIWRCPLACGFCNAGNATFQYAQSANPSKFLLK